ncbi:MAG TPA: hypothetical protein VL866_19720 [Pyrinomonadaceae bacterium]|nr:hypothetical protein [Pyrinomonadaceae bacterium]
MTSSHAIALDIVKNAILMSSGRSPSFASTSARNMMVTAKAIKIALTLDYELDLAKEVFPRASLFTFPAKTQRTTAQ